MTSKIDSLVPAPISFGGTAKTAADKSASTAVASSGAPTPVDKVSLTGNAVRMQQLAQAVAETPEIDTKRVASTRSAIASGSYQVDSKSVAAKLTRMDWELGA